MGWSGTGSPSPAAERTCRSPVARQLSKQRVKQIERQLKRIDAEIRKRLKAEEALERQSEILTSIPGIAGGSPRSSRHLLAPRIERYAPDLLPVECANVIWKKARRREIASATPILDRIAKLFGGRPNPARRDPAAGRDGNRAADRSSGVRQPVTSPARDSRGRCSSRRIGDLRRSYRLKFPRCR